VATQIASLYAKVGANTSDFERKMKGVDKTLDDSGKKVGGFGRIMQVGFGGAIAGGAAAVTALGFALKGSVDQAAEMEQGIADISAAMNTSAEETDALKGLIRDLGLDPKLKVSATEAAAAIGVLGTAGLDVSAILDGAARSTVLLSNATGADMAAAAATASDVMAIFNINAKDMDQAVNGILATTQASKFSFDDYALALAQGGGVAATVGVEFDDFNATIAAISPLFASGSDAGTSLKTMLTNLVPSSNAAEDAMMALGIITQDGSNRFFDASGNLKSMAEIADILNTSLGGLSEEQQNQALKTIFGNDAMRAAAALAGYTDDEFLALKATMSKTDAEEAAAKRMDTLGGKWNILRGIMDQTQIDIGNKVMPQMRSLADLLIVMATENGPAVVTFFGDVATKVVDLVNKFGEHWPTISGIVSTAATSVGEDVGRILGSLGQIAAWFQGPSATTESSWSNFWIGVLDVLAKAASSLTDLVANVVESFTVLGSAFGAVGAGDWGRLEELNQRARELSRIIDLFKSPLQYGLQDLDGARAEGGPVQAGKSYLVGEPGPEIFTPSTNGYIHPDPSGWGGERTLRVVVESPLPTNRQAIRELALALKREIDLTGAVMVR
jgi:TP901 family phage tail tape measure protein